MKNKKTAIVCVIDAVGVDTLSYLLSKHKGKIEMPFLLTCGIDRLLDENIRRKISSKKSTKKVNSYVIPVRQSSTTADSLIGHREMMGIIDMRKFNLFYKGFPQKFIKELESRIRRKTLFNQMSGGMEAIEKNYEYHEKTGYPIVYASKCDPLIQLAMNEEIIPPDEQKSIANTALELAIEMKIPITRAIARSYIRRKKEIIRTANRYDAVLPLEGKTLVDILNEHKVWSVSVGKTSDLVNTKYCEKIKITHKEFIDPSLDFDFIHPKEKDTNIFNIQGIINAVIAKKYIYRPNGTFVFANLVDTDSLFGHTMDIDGSLKSLQQIDKALEKIFELMDNDDILIITTDHGMEHRADYGYHSNETLYIVVASKKKIGFKHIDDFEGLTKVGAIVGEYFNILDEFKSIVKKIY
ncbi:MAG: hypothetical protein ACP5IO_03445 [Elusimicrobiales bacterium]